MGNLPEHQRNKAQESGLILSDQTKAIVKAVAEVNELVAYKMENETILHWSLEVERLAPGTEPEKLAFLIDCFKTEQLYWDRNVGIQNIFGGLKQIKKTEKGYQLLKAIW